jgi:hypothetical protein
MSVLKKIGQVLLTAGSVATELMGFPFLSTILGHTAPVVGTVLGDLGKVAGIISTVEVAYPSIDGAKTGSAKLQAATPLVGQIILQWAQSNLPGHSKLLVPPTTFQSHVQAFTSSFADLMNDFGG